MGPIRESALEALGVGYIVMDEDFRVLEFNEIAVRCFADMSVRTDLKNARLDFIPLIFDLRRSPAMDIRKTMQGHSFRLIAFEQGAQKCYLLTVVPLPEGAQASAAPEISVIDKLTERERTIVDMLADGLTYYEIASELHISFNTVRNHLQNIYRKCSVKNQAQLVGTYTAEKILKGLPKGRKEESK